MPPADIGEDHPSIYILRFSEQLCKEEIWLKMIIM